MEELTTENRLYLIGLIQDDILRPFLPHITEDARANQRKIKYTLLLKLINK